MTILTAPAEAYDPIARRARFETRGAANDNSRIRLICANGNRRTVSVTGQTLATLAFPTTNNKFTSQTGGSLPFNPSYDATGNMTAINNGITLVYDGRNRVASSTGSGITTNYWVNGLGQRVRKTWNGTPTPSHVLFTFAPDGKHIGSYTLTGGLTEETIFLGDTPIATVTGAGTFNLYADHINAIRHITNQTNQTRWSWEQTNAFGSTLPNQNPTGLGTFNYRRGFPGQFYDNELLTWNNGFRTYHAGLGRYLQPDPIGFRAKDFSLYSYVRQNPALYSDMLGLSPNLICIATCMYIGSEIGGGVGIVVGGGGGTLVAPGVGTIGGAAGGQAIGIGGGAIIGTAIGMAVCPQKKQERHAGRIQAQGGGYEDSEAWSQDAPLDVYTGIMMLNALVERMPKSVFKMRSVAVARAEAYMLRAAQCGGAGPPGPPSFRNPAVIKDGGDERIDIEIKSGLAFVP